MHQLILNGASPRSGGPSVFIPYVLPGLPALGHDALVAKHSGAFHHLQRPERAGFYKEETFITIWFAELPLPPAPQSALPDVVSTQVVPVGARTILSTPVHPQASRSEGSWGMWEVSGQGEQSPRVCEGLYLCVDLVNGFNACVLWKEENTIR